MKKIMLLLLCTIAFLHAEDKEKTGEQLYQQCIGCHGNKGQTKALGKATPIGGQYVNTLITKLKDYADGKRNVNGMGALMKGQVESLTLSEMKKVSTYINALSKPLDSVQIYGEKIKTRTFYSNGSQLIVKYPKSVEPEQWFFLMIKLLNGNSYKTMGGATISFPQYDELNGFVVSKAFEKVTEYNTSQKVYNKLSKSSKKVQYVILEGWENKWEKKESKYIKLKLKFPKTGNLKIQVRAILIDSHKKETLFPKDNEELDQQGYAMEEIIIFSNNDKEK